MKDEKQPAGLSLSRRGPFIFFLLGPLILRVLPCSNAFWFDEVWSWQISQIVKSPVGILTNPLAQSDNNHPLNTLWMYLVGDTSLWWIYRLPSLLCGCAMFLLILWMERKFSRRTFILVCLLVGLSFPLIIYSSEARGYAPMLLCAVGCYYLLRVIAADPTRKLRGILFAILCSIGLLFHLTFVQFLLAAIILAILVLPRRTLWKTLPLLFGLPFAVLVALVLIFVRHLHFGGAPDASATNAVASTLSLVLGGPMSGVAIYPIAVVVLILVLLALRWLYCRGRAEGWFFIVAIFVAPAAMIIAQSLSAGEMPTIQIRYLLIPFTFSLILLGRYFVALLHRGAWVRPLCMAILALAMLGDGYHVGRFLAVGRGDYKEAVEHISADTASTNLTWASDSPGNAFRVNSLLLYYQRFVRLGQHFEQSKNPQWVILNIQQLPDSFPLIYSFDGEPYKFDSVYPAYGLSGWSWVLYRKAPSY
ncbi:MAG TPA: glycosyltransferase family 39 protein [Tepidisphaeraceae bacterium]|nr:glycosyltransferase family 39 protein [Tepidisphaeraceae bacterium]